MYAQHILCFLSKGNEVTSTTDVPPCMHLYFYGIIFVTGTLRALFEEWNSLYKLVYKCFALRWSSS